MSLSRRHFGAFSAEKIIEIGTGLLLPLRRAGRLAGDAGHGPCAPKWLLTRDGVLVSRIGYVSLHTWDLSRELWGHQVDGWSSPLSIEDRCFLGPLNDGKILAWDIATGKPEEEIRYENRGVVRAVGSNVFLIEDPRRRLFEAIDREAKVLWSRASDLGHVTSTEDRFLITGMADGYLHRVLHCLDAATGQCLWTSRPWAVAGLSLSDGSSELAAGFPSVAIVGDRVIVTLRDRVIALSLESGEVLASGRPPFLGAHLVSETATFFKGPFALSVFDHREMCEIDRIEYRPDVEPLYQGRAPSVTGFWLTQQSVVWTTMHGDLMAVSRELTHEGRAVWIDTVPNAIMPIGVSPVAHGNFLYLTLLSRRNEDLSILCWESTSSIGDRGRRNGRDV